MGSMTEVAIAEIVPGDNDRQKFSQEQLGELAESIGAHSLAQPITVRPIWICTTCGHRDADEPLACDRCGGAVEPRFEIVAGERRFRAIKDILAWATIPAIVRELDDEAASAIMLAENTGRIDLDPVEEAQAYQARIDRFGWAVERVAEAAGVSTIRVRFRLKLLALRPDLLALVSTGNLPMGYAQILADGHLDANRQLIALRALRENPSPTPTWFRRVVGKLVEEQAQESLFDLSALTVQVVEGEDGAELVEPPHPTTTTPPQSGKTLRDIITNQVQFWREAAAAWDGLGKPFKRQECEAAALALQAAVS